jgi:hypothetical protein
MSPCQCQSHPHSRRLVPILRQPSDHSGVHHDCSLYTRPGTPWRDVAAGCRDRTMDRRGDEHEARVPPSF